ncbi:MAG: hypothetical protein ACI4XA_09115 [Oscillospiraceae bacterium]
MVFTDISRMADIAAVNQTNLTKPAEHRTEQKSSTLASEHTDSFIKSQQAFTPAYTRSSAHKQNSDNNLLQRENSGDAVGKVKNETAGGAEKVEQGVRHIIRAMFVKQGEVISGQVPSVGAKLYAEELLSQLRPLYRNSPVDENSEEYWQPEAAADRLTTFFDCVSLSGGNKREIIENSFYGAFSDTEALFGGRGRLPLECYETKQLVIDNYLNK